MDGYSLEVFSSALFIVGLYDMDQRCDNVNARTLPVRNVMTLVKCEMSKRCCIDLT